MVSSGKFKRHDGFNSVQIKDGYVVKLRKNGSVKAILGKVEDMRKNK